MSTVKLYRATLTLQIKVEENSKTYAEREMNALVAELREAGLPTGISFANTPASEIAATCKQI